MAVRPELVVGLGNPGPKYEGTRHNAGFWLADRLAERLARPSGRRGASPLDACEAGTRAGRVRLVKPTTYMNRSGQAVGANRGVLPDRARGDPRGARRPRSPARAVRLKEGGGTGDTTGCVTSRLISERAISRGSASASGAPAPNGTRSTTCSSAPGRRNGVSSTTRSSRCSAGPPPSLAGDLQPVMKALHTKRCAGGAAAGETDGPEEPGGARGRERRAAEGAEGASPVPPRSAA